LSSLGALGYWLFWLLAASGAYLYLRFDTSTAGAYASIGELEWWFGGVLRSVHRYAADAFVLVTFAHLAKEALAGHFRGFRAFSWISGVPLVWLLYASGIAGYWLVWDARAQFSALATAEWFYAAGIGTEPMARNFLGAEQVSDRLFSLFVFLHIGLPLALLAGMSVHVQRLGRPATVAPRALALGTTLALLGLALAWPVASEPPWDPGAAPASVSLDWFLQFLHPLMYATSPGALWGLVLGLTALLVALPYLAPHPKLAPAVVSPANCNGCGRCVADCPYEAVSLIAISRSASKSKGKTKEDLKALVMPERCAACGICAGACPSSTPFRSVRELVSGIDLPELTVHELRRRVQAALAEGAANGAAEVVFSCERSKAPEGIRLRCLGMLPPAFIEYALRQGATRVRAAGCEACEYRLGMVLAVERFAGKRKPHLRPTVAVTQVSGHEYAFALR